PMTACTSPAWMVRSTPLRICLPSTPAWRFLISRIGWFISYVEFPIVLRQLSCEWNKGHVTATAETPSPPSDGGEGRGGGFLNTPTSVLSPLLRREERKK